MCVGFFLGLHIISMNWEVEAWQILAEECKSRRGSLAWLYILTWLYICWKVPMILYWVIFVGLSMVMKTISSCVCFPPRVIVFLNLLETQSRFKSAPIPSSSKIPASISLLFFRRRLFRWFLGGVLPYDPAAEFRVNKMYTISCMYDTITGVNFKWS